MAPQGLSILLAVEPCDMRRSFDGLAAAVKERFNRDAGTERTMFVFVNVRRDMVKLLWRDATGWCVLGKRLDEREVALPSDIAVGKKSIVVNARTLAALLDGVVRQRQTARSTVHEARAAASRAREEISTRASQLSTTKRR